MSLSIHIPDIHIHIPYTYRIISAISSCRDNLIFNMANLNCKALSNKVNILCENILKFIATPELKVVCDNTVSKILEILKKDNFTNCGDMGRILD